MNSKQQIEYLKNELNQLKTRLNEATHIDYLQSSTIPSFVIDKDRRIIHWNLACEKLTNLKSAHMLNTRIHWKAFYDHPRPTLADMIIEGADEEELFRYYGNKCKRSELIAGAFEGEDFFPSVGKNGRWLQFTASPVRDNEGAITGALETIRDVTERKTAQRSLEESEWLLQRSQHVACMGSFVLDLNTNRFQWSKNMFQIHGINEDEFEGSLESFSQDAIHPSDREFVNISVNKMIREKKPFPMEFRIVKPDGEIRYIHSTGEFEFDDSNHPVRYYGIHRDITDQRLAEEALKDREFQFRTIFNSTSEAIFIDDAENGVVIDCNDRAVELYEYSSKAELLKAKIGDLSSGKQGYDEEHAQKQIKKAINEGPQTFEWLAKKKNGDHFWVEVSLRKTNIGGKDIVLAVVRDISYRKKAEEEIKDRQLELEQILEAIPDALVYADNDRRIVKVNSDFTRIFGYKPEEVIGQKTEILYKSKDDFIRQGKVRYNSEARNIYTPYEIDHKRKNGEIFPTESVGTPVRDSHDNVIGMLGLVRDISDRKKARQKLEHSEMLLRFAIDQLPIPVIIASAPEVKIIRYNRSVVDLLAEKPDNMQSIDLKDHRKFWPTFYPDGTPYKVEELPLTQAIKEGKVTQNREIVVRQNDRERWISASAAPLRNNEGKIIAGIVVFPEITELKRIEAELREAILKQEAAVKASKVGFWDFYPLENKVIYSEEWKKQLGYSASELSNDINEWMKRMHPDDSERVWKVVKQYLDDKGRGEYSMEFRLLHKDGTYRWFLANGKAVAYQNGNVSRMLGCHIDINEHKMAQKALEESENKYRSLIENSNDAIYLFYNRRFEIVNRKFESMFGYSVDEMNNANIDFMHLVAPSSQKAIEERMIQVSKGKKVDPKYEFTALTKSGREIEVETSVTYIPYKDGKATQGIIRDISRRKKAERELIRAKEEAEKSDQLKSAFLANMSHEIRTPMNGILGFANLLKNPNLDSNEQKEYIGIIEQSGKRMLNILNDLIDISKIESGEMEIYLSETNINEQLDYLFNFFSPDAKAKDLELTYLHSLPNDEASIVTDQEKLDAVLTNLIKNALKYTRKGKIEFGYRLKGDHLEYFVKDTGQGIAKDRQKMIFERFVQADLSLNRNYEGAGLGLSISKAYVEMLGGKIWLMSEKGKGSEFMFSIPYSQGEKPQENDLEETRKGADQRSGSGLRILVAEDDQTAILLLKKIIDGHCREVLHADNGQKAVEICRERNDIDLILMDIKMPLMDGYTATKKIRQFNKEIKIIAQTAYAMSGDREKALAAGCNDYITKPLTKEYLLGLIDKHV